METALPPAPARACDILASAAMLSRLLEERDARLTIEAHGGVSATSVRGLGIAVPGMSERQAEPARPCARAVVRIVRTELVQGRPVARLRIELVVPAGPTTALRRAFVDVPTNVHVAQAGLVDRSAHPTNLAIAAAPVDGRALRAAQALVGPLVHATIDAEGRVIAHAASQRAQATAAGSHRLDGCLAVLDRPGAAALPPIAWLTTPDEHVLIACADGTTRWLTVLDAAALERVCAAGLDPFDVPGVHRPYELAG